MSYSTKKFGDIFKETFRGVESDVLERISKRDFQEEDHITNTILTRIEERINSEKNATPQVRARLFSGRGRNSTESFTGADGSLILEVPNLGIKKYFIFQAKKFKSDSDKFDKRSMEQKRKMLLHTPDSFF